MLDGICKMEYTTQIVKQGVSMHKRTSKYSECTKIVKLILAMSPEFLFLNIYFPLKFTISCKSSSFLLHVVSQGKANNSVANTQDNFYCVLGGI